MATKKVYVGLFLATGVLFAALPGSATAQAVSVTQGTGRAAEQTTAQSNTRPAPPPPPAIQKPALPAIPPPAASRQHQVEKPAAVTVKAEAPKHVATEPPAHQAPMLIKAPTQSRKSN